MCELCDLEGGLKITICKKCDIPLVVSYDHKTEFSKEEKDLIEHLFPNRKKRWTMRAIPQHTHCHILD